MNRSTMTEDKALQDKLILLADFDPEMKFQPIKAGFERGGSYHSMDIFFKTWKECFEFCQTENMGIRNPDEMWFALPSGCAKRHMFFAEFRLKYHEKYDWLVPVWVKASEHRVNKNNQDARKIFYSNLQKENILGCFEITVTLIKHINENRETKTGRPHRHSTTVVGVATRRSP